MNVSIYDQTTGEILRRVSGPDFVIASNVNAGESFIEGDFDDREYYVVGEEAVLRPDSPISLSATTSTVNTDITISNAAGASLQVTGSALQRETISADPEMIQFDTPGIYRLKFTLFPYLEKTFEVTINAN